MKKKAIGVVLIGILLCFSQIYVFAAQTKINIVVNGDMLKLEQPPIMKDGVVLVPLRGVFEALGVAVFYEPNHINCVTKAKTVSFIDTKIFFKTDTGSYFAFIDNILNCSFQQIIKNGRTMVPARFIAESFGAEVSWNNKSSTVAITADIPEDERLSEEEIADANAFTVDVARDMAIENSLYRYFARRALVRTIPQYENGIKSQNFVYKDYSAQGDKTLKVSSTGEITHSMRGIYDDYSEYTQYTLAPHAKYLPFQEKYDGYLGCVVYTNYVMDCFYFNFYQEYFSRATEEFVRENYFETVNFHDCDEYLLLFPKYEGTVIEIIARDSNDNESVLYRGADPVRLHADISKLTLYELAVIFTLGEDSVYFPLRTMTPWHELTDEERAELKTENQSFVQTKIEGDDEIKAIPHNRIMNLTSGWSSYSAYEYF